jgi:hypothetical protein
MVVLPGVLGSRPLRRTVKYVSGSSPCGCQVASPSSRSRDGNSWSIRARKTCQKKSPQRCIYQTPLGATRYEPRRPFPTIHKFHLSAIRKIRIFVFFFATLRLGRIFHESPAMTTDMAELPGVLGFRPLRRTVQVRLGTNTLWLPGATPIFVVSRQQFMEYQA